MTDENINDGIPSFFVRGQFPFVFVPASTSNVNFTETSTIEDQTTTESSKTKEKQDTTDDDELNSNENDHLRISQPQYSHLLKKLDFRFNKMVDVTDLLPDPIEPEENPLQSNDEDEDEGTTHQGEPLKKSNVEEDDDTSKQATQNYDLHDNETNDQEPEEQISTSIRPTENVENLSSIPRLNRSNDDEFNRQSTTNRNNSNETTPKKLIEENGGMKTKSSPSRYRRVSSSSDTDDVQVESILQRSKVKSFPIRSDEVPSEISVDEDLRDLNNHLTEFLLEQDKPKERRKHRKHSNTDTWLAMLEKLETEHKQRLEQQQKQYESYMHELEEKMKRRFDEYLSSTNTSFQEAKSETLTEHSQSQGLPSYRPRTYSNRNSSKDFINHFYPSNEHQLSRSQSREDIGNVRLELSAKHSKHISDLKLYYEHEIEELKNQLNRSRSGTTTNSTRQSIETIERINNENIRLHDEVKDLRHSLKTMEEDNHLINRRIEDLRSQLTKKDFELKNSHRTIGEFEEKLTEFRHTKDRQDERIRHADRQALIYREENEKLKKELNLLREKFARLEERQREQEIELKSLRANGANVDETKMNSTMSMNVPTSREYGRYIVTTSRYSSSTITSPREVPTYHQNVNEELSSSQRSPRATNYLNEKSFHQPVQRTHYSPRKSPNRRSDLIENQLRHADQLEEKFDELLRKKRDLEARMNRIPTRGLTTTDRHLLETLEREIERVDQQISSVKLELRKMNILRTH